MGEFLIGVSMFVMAAIYVLCTLAAAFALPVFLIAHGEAVHGLWLWALWFAVFMQVVHICISLATSAKR